MSATLRKGACALLSAALLFAQQLPHAQGVAAGPMKFHIVVIEGEGAVNIIQQKTSCRSCRGGSRSQ